MDSAVTDGNSDFDGAASVVNTTGNEINDILPSVVLVPYLPTSSRPTTREEATRAKTRAKTTAKMQIFSCSATGNLRFRRWKLLIVPEN